MCDGNREEATLMAVKKVWAVYFSPVGNTKKNTLLLARKIAEVMRLPLQELDFTLPDARDKKYSFSAEDIVVFGCPVYAGRVPNKLLPYLQNGFIGNDTLAVPVSVFGGRSFDDALVELQNILQASGFYTIAAAALVGQHAFSKIMSAGRPDELDSADINKFAVEVANKAVALTNLPPPVEVVGTNPPTAYYTPMGLDGQPTVFLKAKPKTDMEKCVSCGKCARRCPLGSINKDNVAEVTGSCIKCHACVKGCPQEAKFFDDEQFLSHKGMLERDYTRRAKCEFFL